MTTDVNRRTVMVLGAAALTSAPFAASAQSIGEQVGAMFGADLTQSKATSGLKEALRVGAKVVIDQVGAVDGYLKDPAIHIPLPGWLNSTRRVLKFARSEGLLDDLETRLNRGAELAAPKATPIFVDAIKAMTVQDAVAIIRGPENAATTYFEEKMTPQLREEFRPVVKDQLEEAGAIQSFNQVVDRYNDAPMVKDMSEDASDRFINYGLNGALKGIFYYLGKEEAKIRKNPAARTTDLLRDVFGS